MQRAVVLCALQWLLVTNLYYHKIHIDPHTLSLLPEDGDMTELISVTIQSTSDDQELQSAEGVDPYEAHLSRNFRLRRQYTATSLARFLMKCSRRHKVV